jgi:hypothetical protein
MDIEMTFEEWKAKYQPIQNHLNEDAPWNGIWFDATGEEDKYVREQNPFNVWAYSDFEEDDEAFLVSGYRFKSGLGHFITRIPWVEGEEIQIALLSPEE